MTRTSIEWLERNINLEGLPTNKILEIVKLFEQAKQMHYTEIIDAHDNGYIDGGNHKRQKNGEVQKQ